MFLLIVAVILRFLMRYVMPIFQMSKMAHRQLNDMRRKMEEMQQQQASATGNKKQKKIDEEYIDYEEIK